MTARQMSADEPQPVSVADAQMISRSRNLGWDCCTYEETQEIRLATMREGLAPEAFDQDSLYSPEAIERAHLQGVVMGLVVAFAGLVIGLALHEAVNTYWPVACDGTVVLPSCAVQIIGALK